MARFCESLVRQAIRCSLGYALASVSMEIHYDMTWAGKPHCHVHRKTTSESATTEDMPEALGEEISAVERSPDSNLSRVSKVRVTMSDT